MGPKAHGIRPYGIVSRQAGEIASALLPVTLPGTVMDVKPWPDQLFSEGDLVDYLNERWKSFQSEVKPDKRRRPASDSKEWIAKLEAKYLLKAPVIVGGFHVIEQGKIADGKPKSEFDRVEPTHPDEFGSHREFVDARVQYLEALLKHISPRTYALVDVPFGGDGDLFRYWPSRCAPPAPQAWLCEKSVRLRIERSGKHDNAWKTQLKADVGRIEAFLSRTRKDVAAHNAAVSETLREMRSELARAGSCPSPRQRRRKKLTRPTRPS